LANELVQRVNVTMNYVKEKGFRDKLPFRSFKRAICVIVLIFNSLLSHGQSLRLKNASAQQLVHTNSTQTFSSYFVLCSIKGNAKQLETDSLCVATACFPLVTPDSTFITKEIVRGKRKTYLRIAINSIKNEINDVIVNDSKNINLSGMIYYRANAKSKTLLIPGFHQLPVQTVKE
jgi:hypothetical protein